MFKPHIQEVGLRQLILEGKQPLFLHCLQLKLQQRQYCRVALEGCAQLLPTRGSGNLNAQSCCQFVFALLNLLVAAGSLATLALFAGRGDGTSWFRSLAFMMASLAASLSALPVARALDLVAAAPAGLKYDAMDLGGMVSVWVGGQSTTRLKSCPSRVNRGRPPH